MLSLDLLSIYTTKVVVKNDNEFPQENKKNVVILN